jgi:uncharacterized protein YndB with AHSA1/START domain
VSDDDLRTIRVDQFLPYPPQKVWRALTEPDLIARWLMPPSGFRLEVGHAFAYPPGRGTDEGVASWTDPCF